jgi:hypothetical protein
MVVLSFNLFLPLLISALGGFWGKVLGAVVTILLISPFLRAMIMKKNHSIEFKALWADSRFNHAPLISIVLLRIVLAVLFVVYIIKYLFQASAALMVGIAILVVLLMIFSRFLKKQSIGMERVFVQNLRSKEIKKAYLGESQPEYAGRLLDRDLHLSDFNIFIIFAADNQIIKKMQEYISRNIDKELIAWKDDSMRKPLLLRGARQVGKSSAVRHFGKEFKYFAEVNFERHKAIKH